MIGIPVGLVYANASEWFIHRYVLHGPGKRKGSFWSFHFHTHHRHSRAGDMHDPDYEASPFGLHGQGRELAGLVFLSVLHLPLLPVAPFFTGTVWYSAARYYRMHKRAHLDPAWARTHLPWHVDHHLGPNQDANWCVTRPWFDVWMKTRAPYVGTEREAADQAKRASLAVRRSVGA